MHPLAADRPLVSRLDQLGGADLPRVGAKAANLGKLCRAGLPVPPGFILTTDAYRLGLTAEVEQALTIAWQSLGSDHACAVRSSATAEDLPQASFAGQQDSFLNVRGREPLLTAVRACWASLMSDRAVAYRRRNSIPGDSVAMAVLVQRMVSARCAGVIFTADPLTADPSRIVIEAVPGLGDALVSGRATPHRAILRRADGRIFERSADSDILTDTLLRELYRLAKQVEQVLGPNQDIEWAADDHHVWLLQSRPITTLARTATRSATEPAGPHWVWTNANTGELVPDVATPLTWSFMNRFLGRLLEILLGDIGKSLMRNHLIGLVAGRVYFNLTTLTSFVHALPGMSRFDITEMFGGAQERLAFERASTAQPPPMRLSLHQTTPAVARIAWSVLTGTRRKLNLLLRDQRRTIRANQSLDLSTLSDRELVRRLVPARDVTADHLEGAMFVITGLGAFDWLRRACRVWLGDDTGALANRLMVGVGDMDSAESALALWRLAQFARSHPALQAALIATDSEPDRLALQRLPAGREFLSLSDDFLFTHGHHARGEVDPAVPRWSERPGYVMSLLRGYLSAPADTDPIAHQRRLANERRQLAADSLRRLRNPLKRWAFTLVLRRAQQGIAGRENLKSELVRIIAVMRSALLEFGRRLTARHQLDAPSDIFFLSLEEVESLSSRPFTGDLRTLISPRKAEHHRNLALTPPPVVIGRFDPTTQPLDEPDPTLRTLYGLAVSAGVAEGRARVILHLDSDQRVLPGEVLVAPFTDPGWTPYFLTASAIVMDMGGMLSHGAIVAREYGVPAVVNVGPATKTIRTGQMLRVDGSRGTVTLLE